MAQIEPSRLSPRGQYWLKHIEQWKQTQTSQAHYCREHGISIPAFGWWKRKLTNEGFLSQDRSKPQSTADVQTPFTEIILPPQNQPKRASQVDIQLPNHVLLKCDHYVDLSQLEQILQTLVNLC